MSGEQLTLIVVIGIAARVSIPIVVTILIAFTLKKLDEHWQAEAESMPAVTVANQAVNTGCWEVKGCPEDLRLSCVAFAHPEMPCWQVFRSDDGHLQEKCVMCEVYKQTPSLIKAPVRVRA